jgi:hypothetical protein
MVLIILASFSLNASEFGGIPSNRELMDALDYMNLDLQPVLKWKNKGQEEKAIKELLDYFKEKSADRYYFNWENFENRFELYERKYPEKFKTHNNLASYHLSTYGAETSWKLPFKDLKGNDVTAYELRHLARQQKSADMTLMYYFNQEDPKYQNYFVRQVADLNRAYLSGDYDDEGNGVFEAYRAGKRIHNWLFNHHAYLASQDYSEEHQLLLVRTFMYHGLELAERTRKNRYGNHHTKGLVALFEIAAVFPEFTLSKKWQQQAIDGLVWHIEREINPDGFQFERSVHYHMGDIENYFRVYQLAKINGIELPEVFTRQFRKMFEAMVKLAQPNRRLPVLQDDTDVPYHTNNDVSGVMTTGTLLFEQPVFRYFAGDELDPSVYWLLRDNQLDILASVIPAAPQIESCALEETGYYIMRSGWDENDLYLTITAGLSKNKPDHQHGDMLGMVAYANGHEILPNYQVRYKHAEYKDFKNSWLKNIALVDSIPLGRRWRSNKGRSGFGKWHYLPESQVQSWISEDAFDYFCGTHSGYDTIGVTYEREVLFLKDVGWLVADHFNGTSTHEFQQVWQGRLGQIDDHVYVKTLSDGSGLILNQVNPVEYRIAHGSFRNEISNTTMSWEEDSTFSFFSLLIPFKSPVAMNDIITHLNAKNQVASWQIDRISSDEDKLLSSLIVDNGKSIFYFNRKSESGKNTNFLFRDTASFLVSKRGKSKEIQLLGSSENILNIMNAEDKVKTSKRMLPGDTIRIPILNN